MALLIKNGRVIDPANNLDGKRDVLIENGKIVAVKSKIQGSRSKVIDAAGLWVLPGLVDLHVHLRDPGRPDKETIASGTRAAALGGFTSVCCMANTEPAADNAAVIKYIKKKAENEGVVNVFPIGAVTKGLKGEALAEMALMLAEGAVAFSDDGQSIRRADCMRRALEYARQFGAVIVAHCEDKDLSAGGAMNESALSTSLGLPAISPLSEETMVARDLMLAAEFGRVHIAHVSSARSVELIRQAKRKGWPVSAETCPHYFSLTEAAVSGYDTNAKVNPPLKSKKDLQAIIRGLADGTIDAIATDHAPHTTEDKNIEFNLAATGLIGLETALGLVLTKLVATKALSLKQAVAALTVKPAKIFNLDKGTLKIGAAADVILVDPRKKWIVDPAKFASKSRNTPFAGWELTGQVLYTIVGGKVIVKDGQLVA